MNLKTWIMASRAPFFVAVIIPSLVGGAIAYHHGSFDPFLLFIVILGVALANGGTNFINDYFDFKSGADATNKNRTQFSGGSPYLPENVLNPKKVLYAGLLCFAVSLLIVAYLTVKAGYLVLVLAAVGGFIGYFYTAPPFKFGYRGIGEIVTGIGIGLIVPGCYYVMAGAITIDAVIAAIPIGILAAMILYVNEIPDYSADKGAGKRHLIVMLGKEKAVKFMPLIFLLVYLSIIFGVVFKIMPVWTLIALLTIPIALNVVKIAKNNYNNTKGYIPAMAGTIKIYAATGILLCIGYLIPVFLG
ncbi:hypothetical protein BEH94_05595 [Candidatus Altiarchaeales archaeon WOR_SM1_SCG]|nr:hypothetical protein BEH94_05595 [Candidatus Altiarchaeales archaeon WOR_SM1_SCG]